LVEALPEWTDEHSRCRSTTSTAAAERTPQQDGENVGEFQRLTGCLNVLIAEIGRMGHRMSGREILNGF